MSEEYEGWSNKETWALKLHFDNDQKFYNYIYEQLADFKKRKCNRITFEDFIKGFAEDIYHEFFYTDKAPESYKNLVQDVGSLWRVNWNELVQIYWEVEYHKEGDEQ